MTLDEMKALPREKQRELYDKIGGFRQKGKATNYSATYGAGAATIARAAGVRLTEAEALHRAYWELNWSIPAVAEGLDTKRVGDQQWVYNPVSRMWYTLRHKKDRWSTLNQGTGVYCFDTWVKHILSKRPQLTGQFHDEIILCIKKGSRDKCEKLLRWAIDKANQELKLNRELDVDVDFGNVYSEIH